MVSNLMFHVYKLTYHYINSVSYPKIPSLPHSCCYIPDLQLFSIFLHSPTPVVTSLICSYFHDSFTPPLLLLYPWFAVFFTAPIAYCKPLSYILHITSQCISFSTSSVFSAPSCYTLYVIEPFTTRPHICSSTLVIPNHFTSIFTYLQCHTPSPYPLYCKLLHFHFL